MRSDTVVGAGAAGLLYGTGLAVAGHSHFLDRQRESDQRRE